MGRITRKTTDFFTGGDDRAKKLLGIHPACRLGTGSKKVSIKLFDKKSLIGDTTSSVAQVKQRLETFFNDLDGTLNLPASVAQNLRAFTFEVTLIRRNSSDSERLAFGMMDFPIYLESTEGDQPLTEEGGENLLIDHNMPERTRVTLILSDGGVQRRWVDTYDEVKSFVKDEDERTPGIGVPGTYFVPGSQARCRKVGIIKINLLIRNIVFELREDKFILVLKHELGHMFGMDHEDDTLMDPKYKDVVHHPDYTVNQISVLSDALTILSQS
jgi:hypothetical protein